MKPIYNFFIVLMLLACNEVKSDKIQLITKVEMQQLLKQNSVQLIDLRTVSEYKRGFIPNAQNIDFMSEDFERNIQKLDKTKPVIVYCQLGGRSAQCAKKMKALGFTKIYDLKGGYSKWESE